MQTGMLANSLNKFEVLRNDEFRQPLPLYFLFLKNLQVQVNWNCCFQFFEGQPIRLSDYSGKEVTSSVTIHPV